MRKGYFLVFIMLSHITVFGQLSLDAISTDFVLHQRRADFDRYLREKTVKAVFTSTLDSTNEDSFREACWSVSQFLLTSPQIENGFNQLFAKYHSLENITKRALLEAMYGTYPARYKKVMSALIQEENVPKLLAMQALYLYRLDNSSRNVTYLLAQSHKLSPGHPEDFLLHELDGYLLRHQSLLPVPAPDISSLFAQQRVTKQKTIYSFQRWNRDYPGCAIIQNEDGSFVRDSNGRLRVFGQLARSASNLPYFITNGNTPQGIYSIQGTEVSHNNIIGPTPNIQMVMPFEADSIFWHTRYDSTKDALANYLGLLPENWRSHTPMTEAFYAGMIGRSEIIVHGTTIDPAYYRGMPFYPYTPTQGCLSANESWNTITGKILQSDQFDLVNAFLGTPGDKGYLIVVNINNMQKAVSRKEAEDLVLLFEHK